MIGLAVYPPCADSGDPAWSVRALRAILASFGGPGTSATAKLGVLR